MIDGFRRRPTTHNLHPTDRHLANKITIGDHSNEQFETPQQVAEKEEQQELAQTEPLTLKEPKKRRSTIEWLKNLSTKQKIAYTTATAFIVAGLIIGSYFLFFAKSSPVAAPTIKKQQAEEPPKPTTVASSLSGVQVDPSINERPVTAVMIENSSDARPQAGLEQASVVFEAIAEGGITRFVALFQDTEPDYVGPVRSVRPYYLQWLMGFDAAIAHAGGSTEALNNIKQWKVKDLNHHANYFWRVNNRTAPHNLYTSIAKLREYEAQKGYGKANFTPLVRKSEKALTTAVAKSINFNISSANFNTHYDYDFATNSYKRSVGGAIHTDEKSGNQLAPKVVVALVVPQGKNGIYTTYQTNGSGQLMVFQDGNIQLGSWKKDSNESNLKLMDQSENDLAINPGQTWFTAIGSADKVTYTP